jgi:hypothetical protein
MPRIIDENLHGRDDPFGLAITCRHRECSDLEACRNFERRSHFLLGALLRTLECSCSV